ncbi:predicted protein [Naegleria gruberi]|uniref:Predicted protein n=1 Tax=Naegleria gruberi TaxID=5762 RepID=D2V8K5_NAEGR|nr:uncharacterized protein NAEGRDRAFT_65191 [Naegleria gruberi]EFC46703.1 predicted protein [Naegleria gruberi]|eukprot:XP_002679447.1 predicted protein [Naegleria gruberi strain NEG-M]
MNNRLLDDDHDDDNDSLLTPGLNQQQQQQQAFNSNTTQASKTNKKWWNLKKDRKSHVVCWMMILGSGLLLTSIGIVSMVLLVIYSPTPKEILNGTSPISEKQWKEIVLETFGVVSGFVIASQAQREVGTKSTSVIAVLKNINFVTKLRTASITLYPIYPSTLNPSVTIPYNESMRIVGYKSSNTISFTVTSLTIIGEVLDKLIELGVTQISSINMQANETAVNNAREQALSLAVQDAKSKIEKVVATLNPDLTIETIRSRMYTYDVNIDSVNRPIPIAFPYFAQGASYRMDAAQSQSVPVVGGDQTIDSYVTVKMVFRQQQQQ